MKIIKGDLVQMALEGRFDVIVHGCNCFCTMGAGIAKLIRNHFPEAYQADLSTGMGDRSKLGDYSFARIKKGPHVIIVVNAYTQFDFSGNGTLVDYDAVSSIFFKIKSEFSGLRIGYPKIGAGLAKGDWKTIAQIIDTQLGEENHTLVEYVP